MYLKPTPSSSRRFARLPESLQAVFVMRELEGLFTQETAETLRLSSENVKVRLHRSQLALRETLSGYFSELARRLDQQTPYQGN